MNIEDFSKYELLEMYVLLADRIADNLDMIDAGDFRQLTKNELLDENKLCNSAKRKLAKALKSVGVDPVKALKEGL